MAVDSIDRRLLVESRRQERNPRISTGTAPEQHQNSTRFVLGVENERSDPERDDRTCQFSDANGDREYFIFSIYLTSSSFSNHTRLMPSLLFLMTIQSTLSSVWNDSVDPGIRI